MSDVSNFAQQKPRYTIDIDEEGYPSFDGMRVDDEAFISSLFENLYRLDAANPASALMTRCEGEACLIDSFDSPWVAQSVEDVTHESSIWVFPGSLRKKVLHCDLGIDEWARVRTQIGPLKINAILTRKAQAAFGHSLDAKFDFNNIPTWYQKNSSENLSTSQFWESVYQDKRDGWEMNEPSPVLTHSIAGFKALLPTGADKRKPSLNDELWVPGAGRGHDAAFLAMQLGEQTVRALDFSPTAAQDFAKLYPDSKVRFECADVFTALAHESSTLAAIFEHTFLCAIDPELRSKYFSLVFQALRPGAFYFGIFWMRPSRGGPPFGLSGWELREHARAVNFEIIQWERSLHSWASRWGQEYWVVMRRPA